MANSSVTLDKWRDYFRTANSNICDIIEFAAMVAAEDCPKELKLRRDRIAEILFTFNVTKCLGCDKVELAVPNADDGEGTEKCKTEFETGGVKDGKESKTNSSRADHGGVKDGKESKTNSSSGVKDGKESKTNSSRADHEIEMNVNQISNFSFREAEALTDEIEEASRTIEEVLRIKNIIDNFQDESDSEIYQSLRKLQLMALSVDNLKVTEIGKSVNALRKHSAKKVRLLVRTLIEDWKVMVDEWASATAAIKESTSESVKESAVDEEYGLPSPPLDDLAFFATDTNFMEFSRFFDGMDDDGNPRNSGEFQKNHEGRRSLDNNIPVQKQQFANSANAAPKNRKAKQPNCQEVQIEKQTAAVKPNKPTGGVSGHGRLIKPTSEQNLNNNEMKCVQKSDKGRTQNKPVSTQQDRLRCPDEDQVKLETTKRKLQERYQEVENAKRQRTIQVMELRDLPKQGRSKQGPIRRNPQLRPGNNNNRHRANGRH